MSDSLFMNGDSKELREQITELVERGYKVRRPTRWQIKVGSINYYHTRGTITADPHDTFSETGFDAFVEILAKRKVLTRRKASPKTPEIRKAPPNMPELKIRLNRLE